MRRRSVLRNLPRLWPAAVAVLIVLLVGGAYLHAQSAVWTGRVEVVMLPPADGSTSLTEGGSTLVDFAAVVERQYTGEVQPDRFASESATLWGGGITEGSRVFLSNSGGQWANNYSRPVIVIEAVSHDRVTALARLKNAASGIAARVTSLQSGVPTSERITVLDSPLTPTVDRVGGSRARSYAAVALLAVGAGFGAEWIAVRVSRRRARRREDLQARLVSSRSQRDVEADDPDRALAEISR